MKSLSVAALVLATGLATWAQEAPRAEVFGGFQYLSLDTRGGIRSRQAFNGWEADAGYHLRKNLQIVADFGCGYKQLQVPAGGFTVNVNGRIYPLLFGPRISTTSHKVTLFAEGLGGMVHESASAGGIGESANRFAFGGGGGFDVKLNRRFTFRLGKADYLLIRDNANLNNLRVSTGMVYQF